MQHTRSHRGFFFVITAVLTGISGEFLASMMLECLVLAQDL